MKLIFILQIIFYSYSVQITVHHYQNMYYYVNFILANGISAKAIIDTASSYNWIGTVSNSSNLLTIQQTNQLSSFKTNIYCPSQYCQINKQIQEKKIVYGSGEIWGIMANLQYYLQLQQNKTLAMNRSVLSALLQKNLAKFGIEGCFSLSANTDLFKQLNIQRKILAFYFVPEHCSIGSYLWIGQEGNQDYHYEINYINILDKNIWSFKIEKIKYQDKQLFFFNNEAIIDTGSTFIQFPLKIYQSILSYMNDCYSLKKHNKQYINCNYQRKYETFKFQIEKKTYSISQKYFIDECYFSFRMEIRCDLKIGLTHLPYIVLGNTFLQKYFYIMDIDNSKIGLAESKYQIQSVRFMRILNIPSVLIKMLVIYIMLLIGITLIYFLVHIRPELLTRKYQQILSVQQDSVSSQESQDSVKQSNLFQ